jgi:hypothetical protein
LEYSSEWQSVNARFAHKELWIVAMWHDKHRLLQYGKDREGQPPVSLELVWLNKPTETYCLGTFSCATPTVDWLLHQIVVDVVVVHVRREEVRDLGRDM